MKGHHMNKIHITTLPLGQLQQLAHTTSSIKSDVS